ncbi:MAG: hypothetical protein D6831_00100 [Aquificota bacterium]|nr:MAG: hypothetical protein D6831_00100 [Aquificota bacterium]
MFYVSKVSPLFFFLAFFDFIFALFSRFLKYDHIDLALIAVFGFVLHTILGAAYQIIPNSQQKALKYPQVSYFVFLLSLLSSVGLYLKEFSFASTVSFVSVLIFTVHVSTVIKNIKPITVKFLIVSVVYMNVASLFFFLAELTGNILYQTAIHTMTIGSMLNAILGVQLAWIPMLLMHTLNVRFANLFFYLHQVSTLSMFLAFYFFDYKKIIFAGIFEFTVLILFLYIVFSSVKSHRLGKIPYVIKFFLGGLVFLISGVLMGIHLSASKMLQFIEVHLDMMILGFGGLTIFGAMLHLMPRIVWNMVYIKKAQSGKQVPNIFQVINEREANISFYALFAGGVFSVLFEFLLKRELSSLVYLLPSLYFGYVLFWKMFKFYRD